MANETKKTLPAVPGKPIAARAALVPSVQEQVGTPPAPKDKRRRGGGDNKPAGRLITALVHWLEFEADIREGRVWGLWEAGKVWNLRVFETARGTREFDAAKKMWVFLNWTQRRAFEELGKEFRTMITNKFDPMPFEMASPDLMVDLGKWAKR
jgi:hypothetical protein